MEFCMESPPIHLSIKSHPRNLKHVRRLMAKHTAQTGFSKEDSNSIILAVDEVCSNIIKHAYKNNHEQKIDLTVRLKADSLIITIIDDGIKFDINSIKPRDINEIKPGELGLYIIRQVMDSVEYSQTIEGFNQIKMIKRLKS